MRKINFAEGIGSKIKKTVATPYDANDNII